MRRSQWSMNLKNCYDRGMQMKNHLSPLCAALPVPIIGWFGGVSGLNGHIFQISNWGALNRVGADCAVSAATEFARLSQAGFLSAGFPCIFQHVSKEWWGFAHFSHHKSTIIPDAACHYFGVHSVNCAWYLELLCQLAEEMAVWESKAELSAGGLAEEDPSMTWRRLSSWFTSKNTPEESCRAPHPNFD